MLESLGSLILSKATAYAGAGLATVVVAWLLKRMPNDYIKAKFGAFMYGAGVACTLGLAKFRWTKGVWNSLVEPYVIDLIDNVVVTGVSRFVEGMRSDN